MRFEIRSDVILERGRPVPVYLVKVPGREEQCFQPTEEDRGLDRETLCATVARRAMDYAESIVGMQEAAEHANRAVAAFEGRPPLWQRVFTSLWRRRPEFPPLPGMVLGVSCTVLVIVGAGRAIDNVMPKRHEAVVQTAEAVPTERQREVRARTLESPRHWCSTTW